MEQRIRKSSGGVKGAPSALVLSILILAAFFLLAGMLVVFTKAHGANVPPVASPMGYVSVQPSASPSLKG